MNLWPQQSLNAEISQNILNTVCSMLTNFIFSQGRTLQLCTPASASVPVSEVPAGKSTSDDRFDVLKDTKLTFEAGMSLRNGVAKGNGRAW